MYKYLPLHISIITGDLHTLHILFSHVICRNPDIHDEYEKCGIIKTINLIIFNVLKELVLLLSLIMSFKIYKPVLINIPVTTKLLIM